MLYDLGQSGSGIVSLSHPDHRVVLYGIAHQCFEAGMLVRIERVLLLCTSQCV